MSKKILWCGNSYYGSPFKVGCNYYSELLAKEGNKVLFIAPPVSPFHNKINEATRLAQSKKGVHKIFENYFIYTPFTLIPPFKKLPSQFYWIIKIWHIFTLPNFKNMLKNYDFLNVDTLVIDNFVFIPLINIIKYKKLVVRVTDRLEGFGVGAAAIKAEEYLIKKADKVIYTSSNLKNYIEKFNKSCFYVPNGVDFNKFQKKYDKPDFFCTIAKPVAVYVGAIESWFDFDLLDYVADELKDVHFLIIGAVKFKPDNFDQIQSRENITFYGKVNNDLIASFLQFSDVGIIPFRLDMDLVHSISPLKLYEYSAAGLHTVATKWRELEQLNSPALLAGSKEDFVTCLKKAVALRQIGVGEIVKFAKDNDWNAKIQKILNLLFYI
ncbi:GumK N-terminal domain-containing glycosyltransferase [Campylobacter concisus]|uniref:GumK N-terminal domain-containing glycosyltransferase n=1 Tax=Campylobacter concisus TaxID=199 RepID=UPI00122D0149|nr:glycosyltransferase [Campylobacter concisus]